MGVASVTGGFLVVEGHWQPRLFLANLSHQTFMTIRVFGKLTPIHYLLPSTRKHISPLSVIFPKTFQSHLHVSPRRLHSTVFAPAWPRMVEKEAYEELIDTLGFILRRVVGREHGLRNRDDDYVSVKELVGVLFLSASRC